MLEWIAVLVLFLIAMVVGINLSFTSELLLFLIFLVWARGQNKVDSGIASAFQVYFVIFLFIGMVAGDVYAIVQYPELRPEIFQSFHFSNPFVPPQMRK